MSDLINYDPSEGSNIVTHAIRQMSESSEIILSVKAVTNWINGFVCYLSNEAGLYCTQQISVRKTRKDFETYVSLFANGSDSRARAAANFCRRVHFLPDSEAKHRFMFQVVSAFRYDMCNALEQFSNLEGQLVQSFFDRPFSR
jgi:hypothetical protein